jgi:hypothetical protein
MKRTSTLYTLVVPLALAAMVFLCFCTPWEQVHPTIANLTRPLGCAPLWSHKFANIPGAQVDARLLGIYFALALAGSFAVGFLAYFFSDRS